MPRINLLPWREELRKERQRNFAVAAAGAVLLAIGGIVLAKNLVQNKIEYQEARNDLLQQEITTLEQQIGEINELEERKARLLQRMQVIEKLQRSRPEIVHLFDELARTIPDGVYLEAVTQQGDRVTIKGKAQSSTRVSAYMRNIDSSSWLTDPGLDVVETRDQGSTRLSEFTIFAEQDNPNADDEEDGA
ncbi:MAG: PilN domain-containing protein [Gammaproteobacteria bacterium]|nr:PilN domain-containing protein [Gammaproteobacteria bacterium]